MKVYVVAFGKKLVTLRSSRIAEQTMHYVVVYGMI